MKLEHILLASVGLFLYLKNKDKQITLNSPTASPELPPLQEFPRSEAPQYEIPENRLVPMPLLELPPVERYAYNQSPPLVPQSMYVSEQPGPVTTMEPLPAPMVSPLAPAPRAEVSFSFSQPNKESSVKNIGGASRSILAPRRIGQPKRGEVSIPRVDFTDPRTGKTYTAW